MLYPDVLSLYDQGKYMLSPQLRRQVDELWKMFWSSGMTNPLTSIEQITYLLFLKRLERFNAQRSKITQMSIYGPRLNCTLPHHPDDERNAAHLQTDSGASGYCIGHETCKWSYIQRGTTTNNGRVITPHVHLSEYVFPWLRILDQILKESSGSSYLAQTPANAPLSDAYFQLPPEKTDTLQRAIGMVDRLFRSVGTQGASADIMGDTFEYLLEEIQTSGKNGQFRTPRHIIRFMIDLIDPQPGEEIVDPAAGTAGFLINSIQHLMVKATPPENLVYEWDGTPHRATGGDPLVEQYLERAFFTGYDNDRTMVRIGWMNMLLHGIENPKMVLSDTLGKGYDAQDAFDIVLANPPFTGTVDTGDLNKARFGRIGVSTNKSELLFVWVALDLLRVGGRAAIIVPDGVLFGTTGAHKELRRRLLQEHDLLGVVSLPAGVFQPYTGVKTSILLFRKIGITPGQGEPPRTREVWFYELAADGRSLDAKRTERPLPNDIWDAEAKWNSHSTSREYFQPSIFPARWRIIDDDTLQIFPEQITNKDQTLGLDELWGLPRDPDSAMQHVIDNQRPNLIDLYRGFYRKSPLSVSHATSTSNSAALAAELDKRVSDLNKSLSVMVRQMLDSQFDRFGYKAFEMAQREAREQAKQEVIAEQPFIKTILDATVPTDFDERCRSIVKEFAKLDGYNVRLKTPEAVLQNIDLGEPKSWSVPVRVWARNSEWIGPNGLIGSHDEAGELRSEYVSSSELYEKDGTIKPEFLESTCIEANDFNLSAGRYRPSTITEEENVDLAALIKDLQSIEVRINLGLEDLKKLIVNTAAGA